jgi:hypothetical protein
MLVSSKPSARDFAEVEMQAVHQIVQFIFAAGNEGEGDDLTLRQKNKRALAHGEFVASSGLTKSARSSCRDSTSSAYGSPSALNPLASPVP